MIQKTDRAEISRSGWLLAAIVVLLSACGSDNPDANDASTAVAVQVKEAALGVGSLALHYSGTVAPGRRVELSSRIMGRIASSVPREGDPIRRDQVLVRIRSREIEAKKAQVIAGLEEAEAALANIETDFERFRSLYDAGSATRKELDDITTGRNVAKARMDGLNARLDEIDEKLGYATIRAPFDGFVSSRNIEEGDLARPGVPLLVVDDYSWLKVVVDVPESEIKNFSLGDSVSVKIDRDTEEGLLGTVSQINTSADPATHQFRVEVRLGRANGVRPGMFARLISRTATAPVVSVDSKSLIHRGQLTGLFVLNEENRAFLRWVVTGRTTGTDTEVLSGLKPGERYVSSTDMRLTDGQIVSANN